MTHMRTVLPGNPWRTRTMVVATAAVATLTATSMTVWAAEPVVAGALNQGYVVVPNSVSPDGSLQVMIPALAEDKQPACQTRLVEVTTGKTLTRIQGECFFEHQGQSSFHPQWSKDGATQYFSYLSDFRICRIFQSGESSYSLLVNFGWFLTTIARTS